MAKNPLLLHDKFNHSKILREIFSMKVSMKILNNQIKKVVKE